MPRTPPPPANTYTSVRTHPWKNFPRLLVDGSVCTCPPVEQQVEQHTDISANCGPEMEIALTIDACTLSRCSQCPL